MSVKSNRLVEAGKHAWSASCAPGVTPYANTQTGFSVGIFKWVPKKSVGLKRSAVIVRVKGLMVDSEKVYKKAEELCDLLDAGVELNQKSYTV